MPYQSHCSDIRHRLLMSSDGFVVEGTGGINGITGSSDVLPVKECHGSDLGIVIARLCIAWIQGL